MTETDFTQRFIFDNHDARGELASLEQSYAHVLAKHDYPQPVSILLGELMAAAALLVGSLKFDGLLTLQVRGEGPLSLLMVECSSEREIRGLARYETEHISDNSRLQELLPNGVLAMTVDPNKGQRYQGLVALDGASLAECLNSYFASSEQLESRFVLHADGRRARGFLLQQLPVEQVAAGEARQASWQHLSTLAHTLSAEELLGLGNETILHRLYHEEQLRLFDTQAVQFNCSCSRERSQNALLSLGEEDVLALLQEQNGQISMDCQFCNQRYLFAAEDIGQIFASSRTPNGNSTVH